MATTPVTKRFSNIDKLTGALQETDRVTLTQTNGTDTKTVNATVAELSDYTVAKALENGIDSLINIGPGLIGEGTVNDPLRLDDNLLKTSLIEKDRINVTVVGNRRTRYLPISRSALFDTKYYNSSATITPPAASVEKTGELKLIRPSVNSVHSVSVGDWDMDGNIDSLQVIERKIVIKELPANYQVIGVQGKSQTGAIIVTKNTDNDTIWFWYATLKNGSLHEDAYINLSQIGMYNDNPVDNYFYRNANIAFETTVGRFICVAKRDATDPNGPCRIRALQVIGTGTDAYLVGVTNWTVSSYCGTYTGSAGSEIFNISDKFIGSASEKCELVDTNGNLTASFVNATSKSTVNLQVIENPANLNEVYLVVQRDHIIQTATNEKVHYTADFVGRITITAQGTGSFVAINRYLTNRPSVSFTGGNFVFTNQKSTYRTPGLDPDVSQLRTILQDGSILLVDDRVSGTEPGLIRVRKSVVGKSGYDFRDIHLAATSNIVGAEQIIDPTPQYVNPTGTRRLYIASPIRVYLNGVSYTLPAQCINLDSYLAAASPQTLYGIPQTRGKYVGLSAKVAYLYAQKSGNTVSAVISTSQITESINNTFIAAIYFPTDVDKSTMLLGQAYSRLGYHRLSYEPQGASVPVSYGYPSQQPNEHWLMKRALDTGQVTLVDFDFFVVRYRWSSADLDTRTVLRNEGAQLDVNGFGAFQAGYTLADGAFHSTAGYVTWALDNTQGGYESCLVDLKKAQQEHAGNFNIDLYAHWYTQGTIADHVVEVQYTTYKGGTMRAENYNWLNDGGVAVQTGTFLCQVDAQLQTSDLAVRGDYIARLDWDTPSQSGTFFNLRPVNGQGGNDNAITFKTTDGSDSIWNRWGAGSSAFVTFVGSWINPRSQSMDIYNVVLDNVLYSRSKDNSTSGSGIYLQFQDVYGAADNTSTKPNIIYVQFNNNPNQVFSLTRWYSASAQQSSQSYLINELDDTAWKTVMQSALNTPATLRLTYQP